MRLRAIIAKGWPGNFFGRVNVNLDVWIWLFKFAKNSKARSSKK